MPIFFKANKLFLDKASIAHQLKITRDKRGLSLEQAADLTKISARYLEALESGDYQVLPAGIYGLNYLREYAALLDLDYEKLLRRFREEQQIYQSSGQRHLFARQTVSRKYFVAAPNVIKYSFIGLVAVISLSYLWFLIANIFVPPKLEIFSPANNFVTGKMNLIVSGVTEKETEILINGAQAMVNDRGEFNEIINLRPGINLITITASRGSKKKNVITREVLYKQS